MKCTFSFCFCFYDCCCGWLGGWVGVLLCVLCWVCLCLGLYLFGFVSVCAVLWLIVVLVFLYVSCCGCFLGFVASMAEVSTMAEVALTFVVVFTCLFLLVHAGRLCFFVLIFVWLCLFFVGCSALLLCRCCGRASLYAVALMAQASDEVRRTKCEKDVLTAVVLLAREKHADKGSQFSSCIARKRRRSTCPWRASYPAIAAVSFCGINYNSQTPWHRSHFGSRYKSGCCGHAGLISTAVRSLCVCFWRFAIYPGGLLHSANFRSQMPGSAGFPLPELLLGVAFCSCCWVLKQRAASCCR